MCGETKRKVWQLGVVGVVLVVTAGCSLAPPVSGDTAANSRSLLGLSLPGTGSQQPVSRETTASAALATDVTCTAVGLSVRTSPVSLTRYRIHGNLCYTGSPDQNAVQLLVHGATYNSSYWDFRAYDPDRYSYVVNATAHGYTTFAYDRLGSGSSDKPLGSTNTVDTAAYVLHQVVGELRSGRVGGVAFRNVVLVGHSLGSIIAVVEDAAYQDASAVLLTGFSHSLNPAALTSLPDFLYPTQLDPQFGLLSPPGYVTTVPGTRTTLFYNPADADPAVISYDERHKDELATGQAELLADLVLPESLAIRVPVFLMNGSDDFLFCGGLVNCTTPATLKASEEAYFSPAAELETAIVPGAGHDLNLHLNARDAYSQMFGWLDGLPQGR